MKVTVIDAVMGAGKTYWMKRELARRTGTFAEHHERFVYITPYLKEAERGMRKRDHLYDLVMSGKSSVSSHRLFEVLNPRTMSLIELGHYTLVIDEATQWGPLRIRAFCTAFDSGTPICRIDSETAVQIVLAASSVHGSLLRANSSARFASALPGSAASQRWVTFNILPHSPSVS
jgi:hypothetical protein